MLVRAGLPQSPEMPAPPPCPPQLLLEAAAPTGSLPPEPEDGARLTGFLPDGPAEHTGLFGFHGPLRGLLLDPVHLVSVILYLLFTPGNVPVFLAENL